MPKTGKTKSVKSGKASSVLTDMEGTGAGAENSDGVLLFTNSTHTSLNADNSRAKNSGYNSYFSVRANDGAGKGELQDHAGRGLGRLGKEDFAEGRKRSLAFLLINVIRKAP